MIRYHGLIVAAAAMIGLGTAPAAARTLPFHATLVGNAGSTQTGSTATGSARVRVDMARQRVSVDLAVKGLTVDDLWDTLVAKPAGPIHFHEYPADGSGAVLVLPLLTARHITRRRPVFES